MKKQIKYGLIIGCLFISTQSFSQTETFDITTYTPPKDFKKDTKQGVVTYTHVNTTTGSFCVIAIYASSVSAGNEQKDFTNEWKDLVITPYKADPNPKTETQTNADGWKAVAGAAAVKQNDLDAYVILTVFTGFGKTVSVLANLNDQAYLPRIDSLLQTMKLDKTTSPVAILAGNKDQPVNQSNGSIEKLGHMMYAPLKGWKLTKYLTEAVFTPADILPGQYFEVRVMPSKPFTGTMQQALAESWNDALQELEATKAYDGDPYDIETEKTSYKGWDYIRGRGVFHTNGNTIDKYDMRLFVVKLNNRIERIAVWGLMNISHGDFSPWVNPLYGHAIEEFFYTLKFDDWKEADFKKASLRGDGIIGLFEGLKLGGGTLNAAYTLFFSNGQVFSGPKFPLQGFYGLNTWVEAELRTRYWGTYTLQNGKGMIKMGYGNIPIKVSGNDIIATTQNTDHKYEKVPSVDGAVFNGTYAFEGDSTSWERIPPSITFTTDGRFIDNGALDILNHQTTDPFNITKEPGSGTYKVKDFTLVFNYTDGRNLLLVFMGEGYDKKNASPKSLTLSFNHDTIYKK
jgi:hypothetical protein